jgi:hypothetical protein
MESAELLQANITWNLMEKCIKIFSECTSLQLNFRCRDPMIVGFATNCAISTYHRLNCMFELVTYNR